MTNLVLGDRMRSTVRVDGRTPTGTIDRMLYGYFVELAGRCINGGLWAEMVRNPKFFIDSGGPGRLERIAEPWVPIQYDSRVLCSVRKREEGWPHWATAGSASGLLCRRNYLDGLWRQVLEGDGRVDLGIGQSGLDVSAQDVYRVRIVFRVDPGDAEVRVSLLDPLGCRVAPSAIARATADGVWTHHSADLNPRRTCHDATLAIQASRATRLELAYVSCRPCSAVDGVRSDVLNRAIAARPGVIRWPGGCVADGYHWLNGIGARESRPTVVDAAYGALEPNEFGTDEFVCFCRAVGALPYINVNIGTATPDEAAAWVQYCNGSAETPYGELRVRNGHARPHGVRIWGIGNEVANSTEIGHTDARSYGKMVSEFARAMRAEDPDIEIVACGSRQDIHPEWNKRVLAECSEEADYLSVHYYFPSGLDYMSHGDTGCLEVAGAPLTFERLLRDVAGTMERMGLVGDRSISVAVDEWTVWLPSESIRSAAIRGPSAMVEAMGADGLENDYRLRDALFIAGMLHAMYRMSSYVKMGCLSELVNWIGTLRTRGSRLYETPLFKAYALYSRHSGSVVVATRCTSPTYEVHHPSLMVTEVPFVDAVATLDAGGEAVFLHLINRCLDQAIELDVFLDGLSPSGEMVVRTLNGPSILSPSCLEDSDEVSTAERRMSCPSTQFRLMLEAHSISIVEVPLSPVAEASMTEESSICE